MFIPEKFGKSRSERFILRAKSFDNRKRDLAASLASQILHGLETPVYSVSDDEVRRRMREAETDPNVITFDKLVAGLRNRGILTSQRGLRII